MLERCVDFFLAEPRRLIQLGLSLLRVGGVLLVAGLLGTAATTAVSVVKGLAGGVRPTVELAEVMAGLPTWWIPESGLGYGFALCCVAAGVWAIHTGRTYQRLLQY
ncbi:hypothetical protein [Ralstonia wenshanensis]|uniref:hypothetical protein n=1 Tax=Ralstonia wenshanensis TaxID=2842456 RepID=UPI002AAC938D|nr:hypothetical protein [Ralstonia wenshanensis]MDY7508801.1 hypothetical protein [Ralstonia wenshanensis]